MENRFRDDIVLLENILDGRSPPKELPLSFLQYMTKNFSAEREIGRGGFGVVYMGVFKNRTVAVKKLTFSKKAEKDFTREVDSLMKVNHENIVRCLGYCYESKGKMVNAVNPGQQGYFLHTEQALICFEYINNGSLTGHLHDELRGHDWDTRYKILREICEGLKYLHSQEMVHRDLKPENILLDNLMVSKIADLGICKFLKNGATHAATNAKATWQYAPPEFRDDGLVSLKYDIYSLGIIIIQLVTGFSKDPDVKNVLRRWRHRWNKSNETLQYQQIAKCVEIGLSCQRKKHKERPSICEIIKDLDDVDGGNSSVEQKIPCWNDLLWVEPPELFFPFEIDTQISCSLELHNETDAHMAFFIKTRSEWQYKMDHKKGVVPPFSHFTINITLPAQKEAPENLRNANEFTIKSIKLNQSCAAEDIIEDIFRKKSGNIVDKVRIGAVFYEELRASVTCAACMFGKGHGHDTMHGWTDEIPRAYASNETSRSILERTFDGSIRPQDVKFSELESITENFSEDRIIGMGGFATIYKGTLPNGEVAVKKINSQQTIDDTLFHRAVNSLLKVNHKNIVRFLGYCSHTDHKAIEVEAGDFVLAEVRERVLCFEYINNGSLENYITDELRGLPWDARYSIIKGICEGLQYLHTEKHIMHMDLKPANILIDHNMVAKITDFGFSRMLENTQTIATKQFSPGYSAPEYMERGDMSLKNDVYSLGVTIIEVVTGYKSNPDSNDVLRRWTHRWRKSGQATPFRYQQIAKLIEIGLQCQEWKPHKRPSISYIINVINELESTDRQISNASESTVGQISPYLEDDMLGIEPLELRFRWELNNQIPCSLELTNETNDFFAFSIQTMSRLPYCIQPNKGIVPPQSKYSVKISFFGCRPVDSTSQYQSYSGLIVWSAKVNANLISEDITEDIFKKDEGKLVDEVNLTVTFG